MQSDSKGMELKAYMLELDNSVGKSDIIEGNKD